MRPGPWLVLLLLPLAGCFAQAPEEGAPTSPTEGAPPASPGPALPPTPAPETGGEPVPFRVLAEGASSELEHPVRLLFTDALEWESFWRDHEKKVHDGETGEPRPASPAPEVDFGKERAVAVTLGDSPDTCWSVRITNATVREGVTTLTVTTYRPGPGQACLFMITQPYAMVAIPADGTEVAYRDEEKVGRVPEAE